MRASASLPATPIGRYSRQQWEGLATDESAAADDDPDQKRQEKPRPISFSSPPSPLRGRQQRASFRPLLYERVDLSFDDESTTAASLPPLPGVDEDDEAAERLLMLLSLPEGMVSVAEILRAVATCYSAQLSQHAAVCGDSSTFELPAAASVALSIFFARRGVRAELESGALANDDEERNLLALLESLPPPPTVEPAPMVDARAAAAAASDGGASARLAAIGGPLDEFDQPVDGEEAEEVRVANLLGLGGAVQPDASIQLHIGGDDDGDDDAPARPPVWMTEPARFAGVTSFGPSPTERLLDPHEMGWALDDDEDESALLHARPARSKGPVVPEKLFEQLALPDSDDEQQPPPQARPPRHTGGAHQPGGGGAMLPPWLEK